MAQLPPHGRREDDGAVDLASWGSVVLPAFVKQKTGLDYTFGRLPVERMKPNGGSVALGHPFGATGARILSQAVKELAALPAGTWAIVSICADGGQGTVALLQS